MKTVISALMPFLFFFSNHLPGFGQDLPKVPKGFRVTIFAKEPLVRNPCAMAFDQQRRLFVSQGPQYRHPRPDTPGDRITILMDSDGDGKADQSKTFAEGFNHIQGLAWHGKDLWVANAPDLTVVRDLDGDDEADEYVLIYGGLGNLEHALHGLNFGPDGMLYMSKGNSKGYLDKSSPELRLAPKAFADLWGMKYPDGVPEIPKPKVFKKGTYKRGYHHPSDDWGREGGILRCDSHGTKLEIFCRGMRNPWDITFDENFDWLGTDQDQDGGDRIISPFFGSHFGWGHSWSPHWTGENHLPTVPLSGPLFPGSGTGVVYCTSQQLPEKYRHVFFINDWLQRKTFVYRPKWDGALMRNRSKLEVFAAAPRGRSMGASSGMLFDPTDIEVGPNGGLWILSWGHGYGAKVKAGKQLDAGRVFRITYGKQPMPKLPPRRLQPYSKWSVANLIEDLQHSRLPVWRTNAQLELLRRGGKVKQDLLKALERDHLPPGAATWISWTLGRLNFRDQTIDPYLTKRALAENLIDRVQAYRILAFRSKQNARPLPSKMIQAGLNGKEPRLRCAAVQAIHTAKQKQYLPYLWKQAEKEKDRITYYAIWRTLGELAGRPELRKKLSHPIPGVRRAALLALLETGSLSGDEVANLRLDTDRQIAELASSFVDKAGTSAQPVLVIEPKESEFSKEVIVRLVNNVKGAQIRYTLDGSEPTDTWGRGYNQPIAIKKNTTIQVALFRGRTRIGPVLKRDFHIAGSPKQTIITPGMIPIGISDLVAKSGSRYQVLRLKIGRMVYSNRRYTWQQIPEVLSGKAIIQTANSDKDVGSQGDEFLTFQVEEDVDLYVGHDRRIQNKPKWLSEFKPTQLTLTSEDTTYNLFKMGTPAGKVTLGGNTTDGRPSGRSQYVVVVTPAPLTPRPVPTKLAEVQAKIKKGDPGRGKRLFFTSASCGNCHRVENLGKAFAPDLSDIGTRADAKTLAKSILNPDEVITEGFQSLVVTTKQGKVHTGFNRKESGLVLEIVDSDGNVVSIRKQDIDERERINKSAMPANYASLLSPRQVADLVAYLSTQKVSTKSEKQSVKPLPTTTLKTKTWGNKGKGFYLAKQDNHMDIYLNGRKVASYIYQHPKVKRPFFAHVKTPSGIQVTRNFPPIKGKDATDHAMMHPGIWIAFADLNRMTFWHNTQGKVIHKGFVKEPFAGESANFEVLNEFLTPESEVIGRQRTRYQIYPDPAGYLLRIDSRIIPREKLIFGVREEGGLGIRMATPLTVKNGKGSILNSHGHKNERGTWGKVAQWWDYSGKIDGRQVGVMVISDPANPDVWSHSRDYGVIVLNPFPVDRKENLSKDTVIVRGKELRLKFGILIHETNAGLPFSRKAAFEKYTKRWLKKSE